MTALHDTIAQSEIAGEEEVLSSSDANAKVIDGATIAPADVARALKRLTTVQRGLVRDGCIHGDFQMRTVYSLRDKGLFHLVIDSPNGLCGFMRLTPLGDAVQAAIRGTGDA